MKSILKHVASASLLAAIGFAAAAQTPPPPPGPGPMMQRPHAMDPARMQDQMQDRMAKRLADMKTVLRITPAQEGAWSAFTAAMKPQPGAWAQRSPEERDKLRADMDKLSTPERIDRMRALHNERHGRMTAEMDRRATATKTFYAALGAEQQKVFDVAYKRMEHGRMGRGGMGHSGMGPMGMEHMGMMGHGGPRMH